MNAVLIFTNSFIDTTLFCGIFTNPLWINTNYVEILWQRFAASVRSVNDCVIVANTLTPLPPGRRLLHLNLLYKEKGKEFISTQRSTRLKQQIRRKLTSMNWLSNELKKETEKETKQWEERNNKTNSLPFAVVEDLPCDSSTHGLTAVVLINKNWIDARAYCRDLGMELTAIETQTELDSVVSLLVK